VSLSHFKQHFGVHNFRQNVPHLIFGYPPPRDPSAFTEARVSPPPPGLLQVSPCDSKSLDHAEAEGVIRFLWVRPKAV
jgi:hypothetical protein